MLFYGCKETYVQLLEQQKEREAEQTEMPEPGTGRPSKVKSLFS
jgi:hypothetical protein